MILVVECNDWCVLSSWLLHTKYTVQICICIHRNVIRFTLGQRTMSQSDPKWTLNIYRERSHLLFTNPKHNHFPPCTYYIILDTLLTMLRYILLIMVHCHIFLCTNIIISNSKMFPLSLCLILPLYIVNGFAYSWSVT